VRLTALRTGYASLMVRLILGPTLATTLASGCGSTPAPQTPVAVSAPAAWLAGAWRSESGDAGETWVQVDDRMIGVGFATRNGATTWFEVMMLHTQGDDTLLTAIPGGTATTEFTAIALGETSVELVNPAHDDPKRLRYTRTGDELHIQIDGDGGERTSVLRRVEPRPAAALAEADRSFDADSAARAGATWAHRVQNDAAMWSRCSERTVGHAAIAAAIDGMAARGQTLRWTPVAAEFSASGDMGFTTGRYRIEQTGAEPSAGSGIYVTVWRRNSTGAWRIAFDTGLSSSL